jgi:amino acid permease
MMVGLFGVMILFQVILYKFIGGVINELFSYGYSNMENFANESFWGEKKVRLCVCYSLSLFILFPLCLIKTISKMRYASTFGVFSVFLVIIIVLIQCPSFYYHNVVKEKQEINVFDFSNGFDYDLKFIQSISTIIYAYECHAGIFPAISSLKNPTRIRVQKVFKGAATVNAISYIIITISGYLSQPENTPDLILEREKISKNDYLMTLGLSLFSITLTTKVSATYNCLRALILNLMKFDPNNYPNGINLILTTIILSFTTFVAAMFQNISDYISINGSFYGLFISVIMPGIIYIKSNSYPISHIKNILAILFIIILCSIGAITFYFTLKKIFEI